MFDKIDNHVEQAQGREVKQFKGKENIDNIIQVHADRIQQLENIIFRMLNERAISTSVGVQLDGIGETYGDLGLRGDRTDDEYRAYLQSIPARISGAGQHELLISIYSNLTSAVKVDHQYLYPRVLVLYAVVNTLGLLDGDNIKIEMDAIRAQGERLILGETLPEGEGFVFADNPDGDVTPGSGLQDDYPNGVGGIFGQLI